MKNLSIKELNRLQKQGMIRGYSVSEKKKGFSSDRGHQGTRTRTKALDWLAWNLPFWCNENGLQLEKEYLFCAERKFRFDWAISPDRLKICVEYEGGLFMNKSGHTSVSGFNKDAIKYNLATTLGWRIIRVTALNYTTVFKQLNELIK